MSTEKFNRQRAAMIGGLEVCLTENFTGLYLSPDNESGYIVLPMAEARALYEWLGKALPEESK